MDLIVQSLQFQQGHFDVCVPLALAGASLEVELASQCSLAVAAVGFVALQCCCRCRPMYSAFVISGNPLFWKAARGDVL